LNEVYSIITKGILEALQEQSKGFHQTSNASGIACLVETSRATKDK